MRVMALIVVVATAASPASAQGLGAAAEKERLRREAVRAQEWIEFKPASGDFKVLFPYPPMRKRDSMPGLPTMMDSFVAVKQERSFGVWEGEVPKEEMAKRDRNELFDAIRQAIVEKGKATILDEKPVALGGHAGRELRYKTMNEASAEELVIKTRVFAIPDRVFLVISAARAKEPDTPATDRFFASFEILR